MGSIFFPLMRVLCRSESGYDPIPAAMFFARMAEATYSLSMVGGIRYEKMSGK